MPSRNQLTQERLNALIAALGEAGIIDQTEADGLRATRAFNEAVSVHESTPEPPAVTRSKISQQSHDDFLAAREAGDVQTQLDVLFHILTGEDPRDSSTG